MTVSRKRSASLRLTTMLAGAASLTLAGCEEPTATGQWDAPGERTEALSYADLQACKDANAAPDDVCETAYATALKDDETDGPRYTERANCDEAHGAGSCVLRTDNAGQHYFGPFMAGFIISGLMNGSRSNFRGTSYYQGRPPTAGQREEDGGGSGGGGGGVRGFYSAHGDRVDRDYRTGRTMLTRSSFESYGAHGRGSAVSRGGFGGGRSFGGFGG